MPCRPLAADDPLTVAGATLLQQSLWVIGGTAVIVAYGALTVAAMARIGAPRVDGLYDVLLIAAAGSWTLAFALICWTYAPILTGPRPDGKPG